MAIEAIEQMTAPLSRRDDVLEKLKKNDPDKELRDKGILPPLQKYAMSAPDSMAERNDMMETFSQRYFGKALKDLTDDEVIQIEEMWNDLISKTKRKQSKGIMQLAAYPMGYPGRAEEDMERAYDDYQKKHMLGTPGYESPLFDEDGIIQIDPSTVFGLWMES